MDSVVFEFKEVKKTFGDLTVLDDLTFSVKSKEFVALVGNNGSGKTTTIKTLCNLIPYNNGSIIIFDREITPLYVSYRSRIGVFLSEPILINEFSPTEYLRFICKFQGIKADETETRVKEILRLFAINNFDRKKICDYSSGDKIKISLAASIIHNPEVLILDEPFIHLDIKSLDMILNLLLSFKERKTLFITSHNLDLIYNLCERILIMDGGHIIDDISNSKQMPFQSFKDVIKRRLTNKKKSSEPPNWLI
jgi:ABC-type multidrug transport system ATPase subunit